MARGLVWRRGWMGMELLKRSARHRVPVDCGQGTRDTGWRLQYRPLATLPAAFSSFRPAAAAWQRLAQATDSAGTLADLLLLLCLGRGAVGLPATCAG